MKRMPANCVFFGIRYLDNTFCLLNVREEKQRHDSPKRKEKLSKINREITK
jgi:hypothetical protein